MYLKNKSLLQMNRNNLILFFAFIFMFALLSFTTFLLIDIRLYDFEMILLSFFFFFFLTYVILSSKNKFTPLVFFSFLFYGYVLSGLYFSFIENIHVAKFFNFSGNFDTKDMKISLYQVICGYLFFVFGYSISRNIKVKNINFEIRGLNFNSKILKNILIWLFLISFFYWIYVSFRLAGGPIELLSNMGIYRLLLKTNYISTAPYLLAYIATSLLFLIYLHNNNRIPFYLIGMIFISFIMKVSTGRLSGAVFLLMSFPLMYIIHYQYKVTLKVLFYVVLFILLLGCLYFYRFYSNLSYLGLEIETDLIKLIGEHFFGKTNFGDLQSITFADQYTKDVGFLYGNSFTDFMRLWINKLTGLNLEITSIGLRLREYYFSHVSTGAPAPGSISEMIINFGYFGITIVIFLFGVLTRIISKSINPKRNVFNLYVYTSFLLFIMLLAKVDSSLARSLMWSIIPLFSITVILSILGRLSSKKTFRK